jgi:hypothetical protein
VDIIGARGAAAGATVAGERRRATVLGKAAQTAKGPDVGRRRGVASGTLALCRVCSGAAAPLAVVNGGLGAGIGPGAVLSLTIAGTLPLEAGLGLIIWLSL